MTEVKETRSGYNLFGGAGDDGRAHVFRYADAESDVATRLCDGATATQVDEPGPKARRCFTCSSKASE